MASDSRADNRSIRNSLDIAAEAAKERDSRKLLELVKELNDALGREANEKRSFPRQRG